MNARSRIGRIWLSVRPTTRRGAILATIAIVLSAGVLSVVFFVGALMASTPYLEYSLIQPDANARAWAALEPGYANAALCAECHEPEHEKLVSATHAGIGCESCHGALLDHSLASPGTAEAAVEIAVPTDEVCLRCHAKAEGRPISFRQIVPSAHYVPVCLQCHDPHTGISNRPPITEHPLDDLPPCLVCHGPEGFKTRNLRHPAVTGDDKPCLACHAVGRGPEEEPGLR